MVKIMENQTLGTNGWFGGTVPLFFGVDTQMAKKNGDPNH